MFNSDYNMGCVQPPCLSENACQDDKNENLTPEEEQFCETDSEFIDFILKGLKRSECGRIIMPIPWNHKNSHLLGKNYKLSIQILKSTLKKLKNTPELLKLYDSVFLEQIESGVTEKIENLENFLNEHPEASFMAHSGVFKLDRETSKCRIVMLSNLCEKIPHQSLTVSHNMSILAGPTLNHTITLSLMLLRFDDYLLIFDLKKKPSILFNWKRQINTG